MKMGIERALRVRQHSIADVVACLYPIQVGQLSDNISSASVRCLAQCFQRACSVCHGLPITSYLSASDYVSESLNIGHKNIANW